VLTCYKEDDEGSQQEGNNNNNHHHQGRSVRSASLDALLLTGLANSSGSDPVNPGDDDAEDDCGEGPNKRQKRPIKAMKPALSKDANKNAVANAAAAAAARGRKGKNGMGLQMPLGLTMPMGMPSELAMGMQLPLSMLPGGLPLHFHHAMYLQQQQQQQQGGGGSAAGGEGSEASSSSSSSTSTRAPLLYNSPFSQQLVECLMKMPMYSANANNGGAPPPLHSAESAHLKHPKEEKAQVPSKASSLNTSVGV